MSRIPENRIHLKGTQDVLFPDFAEFMEETGLVANARGIMAARLPRILGQGKTRADGLDMPPALIERQQELIALTLPKEVAYRPAVVREIQAAKRAVKEHAERMRHPDIRRRFALQALSRLEGVRTGNRDNQFFAGRFVLVSDRSGQSWAWSMTRHYPVIDKIPADIQYVVGGFHAAHQAVDKWTLPVEVFLDRLTLAWDIAKQFTRNDDVLIADVARLFKIAVQKSRFWAKPSRRNFEDVPEAVFIANLINWRGHRSSFGQSDFFDLIPATLNQAHGTKAHPFFVPSNPEGTVVRPMIYIRRKD